MNSISDIADNLQLCMPTNWESPPAYLEQLLLKGGVIEAFNVVSRNPGYLTKSAFYVRSNPDGTVEFTGSGDSVALTQFSNFLQFSFPNGQYIGTIFPQKMFVNISKIQDVIRKLCGNMHRKGLIGYATFEFVPGVCFYDVLKLLVAN